MSVTTTLKNVSVTVMATAYHGLYSHGMSRACVIALALAWPATGHADARWPVRLQVAFPVGYTGGWDVVHGFTWGFRGAAAVHLEAGFAFGAYGEVLLDAETHHMSALGGTLSYPVYIWPGTDTDFVWRLGAHGGVRFAEGSPDRRGTVGLATQIAMPFYLYEASL